MVAHVIEMSALVSNEPKPRWVPLAAVVKEFCVGEREARAAMERGVAMGYLKRGAGRREDEYASQDDEVAGFWQESDYLDRQGTFEPSAQAVSGRGVVSGVACRSVSDGRRRRA